MSIHTIFLFFSLFITDPVTSFELSRVTRGNQRYFIIKKDITILNVNNEIDTLKTSLKTWKSLNELCRKINLASIPKLKVDNTKQRFDGAMIAHFTVNTKNNTYQTNSFDHDSPPTQLKNILSIMIKCHTKVVSKF